MRPPLPLVTVGLAFMAAAVAPTPTVAAPSAALSATCSHSGKVNGTPGMNIGVRRLRFTFSGTVGPCRMSDGSIRHGTESGQGTVSGGCAARYAKAVWTISWSNGTQTVVRATFTGAFNAIATTGPVVDGAFSGGAFRDVHFLSGFDPMACGSPVGVTNAAYQGMLQLTAQR
jgi:hypothetical protein